MKKLIIYLIQTLSNFFRYIGLRSCRFHPSCSAYSIDAFSKRSMGEAFYLMAKRILRCHPFSPGGYDPLPEREPR